MENKKISFSKDELLLLISLASVNFVHIIDFMIMMPLGPQLMRKFFITPHEFGMLVSAYTFAAAMSSVSASFFLDRFDRKSALLFFFSGFCIGTFACGFAPTYSILITARFATGLFGGVLGTVVLSIVGDKIESGRRGSAMGIVMAAFSAASIFGVPLSVFLANKFDWQMPFHFLGALALMLILMLKLRLENMRGHLKNYVQTSAIELLKSHFCDRKQLRALTFMFFLVFGHFTVIPFLSPSLVANAGLTEAQLPWIYMVGGGVSIFTSPMIGRASDRFGKIKIFTLMAILSSVPTLIITHLSNVPLAIILPVVGLFFAAVGGRMVPAMAITTGLVPPEKRGSFMSLVSSTQQMATALSSYVAGIIVVKNIDGRLMHYNFLGYMAVFFSLIAIYLAQKLHAKSEAPPKDVGLEEEKV